jgi:hypothetical protein
VRNQVLHPYKTTGNILVLYILILVFLDIRRKAKDSELSNGLIYSTEIYICDDWNENALAGFDISGISPHRFLWCLEERLLGMTRSAHALLSTIHAK